MTIRTNTPKNCAAQATPRHTYDGISAQGDLFRRQAERRFEMLLQAMIRELESMGALS